MLGFLNSTRAFSVVTNLKISAMKTAETSTDIVRIYLRDIGRVPLLTRDQELLYGKQVQYMAALNQVKDSLSAHSDRDPTIMEWALAAGLSQSDLQKPKLVRV